MLGIVHARHITSPSSVSFHLTIPNPTPWSLLIPAIQDKYTVKPIDLQCGLPSLKVYRALVAQHGDRGETRPQVAEYLPSAPGWGKRDVWY